MLEPQMLEPLMLEPQMPALKRLGL